MAETMFGLPSTAWPFLLTGAWCILASLVYVVLGCCLPWKMPRFVKHWRFGKWKIPVIFFFRYYGSGEVEEDSPRPFRAPRRISRWRWLVPGVALYYTLSCGIERIYQPMVSEAEDITNVVRYYFSYTTACGMIERRWR